MTRILAVLFAIMCAAPVLAETLPPGLDPQNTIFLDTKYGRVDHQAAHRHGAASTPSA